MGTGLEFNTELIMEALKAGIITGLLVGLSAWGVMKILFRKKFTKVAQFNGQKAQLETG